MNCQINTVNLFNGQIHSGGSDGMKKSYATPKWVVSATKARSITWTCYRQLQKRSTRAFFLYTSRNRDIPYAISYKNATSIITSPFNATLPSKIMIHGFGSSCHRVWAREMRMALISVVSI